MEILTTFVIQLATDWAANAAKPVAYSMAFVRFQWKICRA